MPLEMKLNAGIAMTILLTLAAGILCAIIVAVAVLEAKPYYGNQRTSLPLNLPINSLA